MRFLALIASCLLAGGSPTLSAQSRALRTSSPRPIVLPATPGNAVVLGSVLLGSPRKFSMFNIQAAGTISPDPDMNGGSFQLQFLICDRADCTGDLHWAVRILPDADAGAATRVIVTRSFGVSTHNVEPVVLTKLKPAPAGGVLYLAAVIRTASNPRTAEFSAKLNLLRVDVMP